MNSLRTIAWMCLLAANSCQQGIKDLFLEAFTSTGSPGASNLTVALLADTVVAAYYSGTNGTFQFPPSQLEALGRLAANQIITSQTVDFHHHSMDTLCQRSNCSDSVFVFPDVQFYPEIPVVLGQENRLLCFLKEFFPPEVSVAFLKNGKPFRGQIQSSELTFGRNWTFQVLKSITVEPGAGDTYSCTVEHGNRQSHRDLAFEKLPMTVENNAHIVVLAVGLAVGILGFAMGLLLFLQYSTRNPYMQWLNRNSVSS